MTPVRTQKVPEACVVAATWLALALTAATLAAQLSTVGVSAVRVQRFENENLIFYVPEAFDQFAYSLASGDFNGDGADDLATGMPYDDGLAGGGPIDSGSVVIRYGIARRGLDTGLADQVLNQIGGASPDPADETDYFGSSLASCDFNGDGFDDLAVGIPYEDHLGHSDAGAVQIYYGSSAGISNGGIVFYTQSTDGVPDSVEAGDLFGEDLACGDFNGDGFADLAIGSSAEDAGGEANSGLVTFIPGSSVGTRPDLATALDQNSAGMDGGAEAQDLFGDALGVGDFDGDGFDDLAIGVTGEVLNGTKSGAVHMVWGGAAGITSAGNFLFSESALGGTPEHLDAFGRVLAAGDFDGDGFDDLVIGVPYEDLGPFVDTGNVGVVYGDPTGLFFGRSQGFDQDSLFGAGYTESQDFFGAALVCGDFDRDGRDDLAIAHPREDFTGIRDGAVSVLMGAPIVGLSPARAQFFLSGYSGIPGNINEPGEQFGFALAGGDFDGDGHGDLAIGMPFANGGPLTDAGAEIVLYGALFADGFGADATVYWSAVVP